MTWRDWFTLNGLEFPNKPRPSFDRGALAISAAVDGMGIALETTRLAEREFARGELIEFGEGHFKPFLRETHFLSYRTNERNLDKVKLFRALACGTGGNDRAMASGRCFVMSCQALSGRPRSNGVSAGLEH